MIEIKCYVCNTATGDWGSNLNGLKSQHSNALITDLLKRVLNGFQSMRNIDNELNTVCIDCFNKIEDYDWICLRAKQTEKDLYNILMQTENDLMIDTKPILNFSTNADAFDTQSIIEPEMISVNEMFDVKPIYNDVNDEEMEMEMSFEGVEENDDEESFVSSIKTPFEICNPIDVDGAEAASMRKKSKRSIKRPKRSSEIGYACSECRMVFGRITDLRVHSKITHQRTLGRPRGSSNKIWECTDCKAILPTSTDLRAHRKHVHERTPGRPRCSEKLWQCTECKVQFETSIHLRAHNKNVHQRTVGRPKKKTGTKSAYIRRIALVSKNSKDMCTKQGLSDTLSEISGVDNEKSTDRSLHVTSSSIIDKSPIKSANLSHTEDTVEPETNNTTDEFHDDLLTVMDDPDFVNETDSESSSEDIDQSDEDFVPSKSQNVGQHKAIKSPIIRTDRTKIKRRSGRPSKNPDMKFECTECDEVFDTACALNTHKAWHRDQNFPKLKCKKCYYISDSQETFDAHLKLHENVPPLQCVFCDYLAPTKSRLNVHTVKHITVKQFTCEICSMQFVRRTIFVTHLNYHMNNRRYSCPEPGCSMTFIEKKNLNRHMKSHTGVKNYKCSLCPRRFAYSYNVRNHERTHTERDVYRKFKCNVEGCKSGFDSRNKLNLHLQKKHALTTHSAIAINLEEISGSKTTTGRWAQKDPIVKNQA